MLLSDLLEKNAKDWWYHKELRRQGKVEEAQKRERMSTRSILKDLKDAKANDGWCSVGRGGWTLHPRSGVTVSNYVGMDSCYPRACIMMGIPVIDSTTIPDSEISQSILFPMAAINPDLPPWGSCSYAPVAVVAALYAAIGATLYHIKPDYGRAREHVRKLPDSIKEKLCT